MTRPNKNKTNPTYTSAIRVMSRYSSTSPKSRKMTSFEVSIDTEKDLIFSLVGGEGGRELNATLGPSPPPSEPQSRGLMERLFEELIPRASGGFPPCGGDQIVLELLWHHSKIQPLIITTRRDTIGESGSGPRRLVQNTGDRVVYPPSIPIGYAAHESVAHELCHRSGRREPPHNSMRRDA